MGMSFSVVFTKAVKPYGTLGSDHKALVGGYEKLDKVAAENKLATLGQFVSADPDEMRAMAEDFGMDPAEMDAVELPPLQWFDARDGLSAVKALAEFLKEKPKAIAKSAALLEELVDIQEELEKAAKAKVKFHFELVM